MERQRGLFDEGEESEEVLRRLQEEVRDQVRDLVAEMALSRLRAQRKEAPDES